MSDHIFYSLRTGSNPSKEGFSFNDFKDLFQRVYGNLSEAGYFDESFGFWCVDAEHISGKITDVDLEIFFEDAKKRSMANFGSH